jgi:transcriptional regulator with XRE-family HTH domain
MTTAELLRTKREEAGMTQSELADTAGMKRSTYYNWEAGRCRIGTASSDAATRVALALRISPKRVIN